MKCFLALHYLFFLMNSSSLFQERAGLPLFLVFLEDRFILVSVSVAVAGLDDDELSCP